MALSERPVAGDEGRARPLGLHVPIDQRAGEERAPGSGVPVGTQYHWYILAHQRVRKIDADSYTTLMSGVKYKIAHKRPHWRKWSSEYPDQPSETEKLMHVLEETLARLRESAPEPSLASGMLMAARP
ncbi:MAG TPA: hypothetical protein VNA10_02780 [Thermoplasmata archaeon]|nr:hypothetical protein [Thermoplasmata archaeon]